MSLYSCVVCGRRSPSKRCPRHQLRKRPRGNAFEPTRQAVLARDGYVCQLKLDGCTITATHVDHIVPFADGGSDDMTNLQAACAPCNLKKGRAV